MGLNFALLAGAIWLGGWYIAPWLGPDNAGAIWMLLGILGLAALSTAIQLVKLGTQADPRQLGQRFLYSWGLGLGVVTCLGVGIPLALLLIVLPITLGQPWLYFPWLAILLPALVLAGIDFVQGKCTRTPAHLGWLVILYLYHLIVFNALLLIPAVLGLALFPVGLVVQFISGVELLARWLAGTATDSLPLLCTWADLIPVLPLSPRYCGPILVGFHLGHPLGMFLAARYFETYLTWSAEGHRRGMEWIRDRITPRS